VSEAITTGVFGTLITAILIYLVARVDRLADKLDAQGERLAHIEGRLDEHLRADT
jgi:uncharacterized membrane protein